MPGSPRKASGASPAPAPDGGAPARPSALAPEQGPEVPGAPPEPVLDVADIQGNVLVGFNKDYQTFLFLQITKPEVGKAWLRLLAPHVATTEEVLAFRRLYRALRRRRAGEPAGLAATWVNVAFTYEGIKKLTSEAEADLFPSDAFRVGLAARSGVLGDPTDPRAEGHPANWVVGGPGNRPDVLLVVASDSAAALKAEVRRLKAEIKALQGTAPGKRSRGGLRVIYEQAGANLPGRLGGHEHFGFKDGVSQPGVRGRVSAAPQDFLTPRLLDAQDPRARTFARPGQPLIWPGQFVLGYPLQDAHDDLNPAPAAEVSPAWARNGSFLVFRRLRQDVARFRAFARVQAALLAAKPAFAGMTAERFAALMVGRWPSGAPVARSPDQDNEELGRNPLANNAFGFAAATAPPVLCPGAHVPPDPFPPAPADRDGVRCPFAAHVRKINPRDETTDQGGPRRTLQLRLLRRGIPYGAPLADPADPADPGDKGDRGLLFVSYQAFLEDQFEFLAQGWANSPVNPQGYDAPQGKQDAGHDPVIGQNGDPAAARERSFVLRGPDGSFETIRLPQEWVVATGGDYFFAPSISALKDVLAR
jgi:Dyp-type peroxidase family